MKKCAPRVAHPLCRPPKHAEGKIWRLGDRGWRLDNGQPGLAFIGRSIAEPDTGLVWVANCRCKVYRRCAIARALAKAADLQIFAVSVEHRRSAPKPRTRAGRTPR